MDTPPASIPPPPPPVANSDERTWSMLAHLSALCGFIVPFGSILGPILVWQIKKHELPAVIPHAKAVLNFQISCLIYIIVCIPLMFLLIGIPLMMVIGLGNIICVIIAGIKTNDGKPWSYPATIKFLK